MSVTLSITYIYTYPHVYINTRSVLEFSVVKHDYISNTYSIHISLQIHNHTFVVVI